MAKTLERVLEESVSTGEVLLCGRKIKEYPKNASKFNLKDTVNADLSRNRLTEVPSELWSYAWLERLSLHNNTIKQLPSQVYSLQQLSALDISRNQLTELPGSIGQLSNLQILNVSDNRLTALPHDIGSGLQKLTQLDVSHNSLHSLPPSLGHLHHLRSLLLRRNKLQTLPPEVCYLRLSTLDMSSNMITALPTDLRFMLSLTNLTLDDNPLLCPPAQICRRGRVHIFKWLELSAGKEGRRGGLQEIEQRRSRKHLQQKITNHPDISRLLNTAGQRNTLDSGYSTSDGMEANRWSQFSQESELEGDQMNHSTIPENSSGLSTPSTLSPTDTGLSLEDEFHKAMKQRMELDMLCPEVTDCQDTNRPPPADLPHPPNGPPPPSVASVPTYKDYLEAKRQQRAIDSSRVYSRTFNGEAANGSRVSPTKEHLSPTQSVNTSYEENPPSQYKHNYMQSSGQTSNGFSSSNNPQKAPETNPNNQYNSNHQYSRSNSHENNGYTNNSFLHNGSNGLSSRPTGLPLTKTNGRSNGCNVPPSNGRGNGSAIPTLRNSPISPLSPSNSLPKQPNGRGQTKAQPTKAVGKVVPRLYNNRGVTNSKIGTGADRRRGVVEESKLGFTHRREIDKQQHEKQLLDNLRNIIESRLKVSLPDSLGAALLDGVVLCHLVNHVRPRAVPSIHVPSPAVPKLTVAKCRLNVESFLEACKKIGVEEGRLFSTEDVLESPLNVIPVLATVHTLVNPDQPLPDGVREFYTQEEDGSVDGDNEDSNGIEQQDTVTSEQNDTVDGGKDDSDDKEQDTVSVEERDSVTSGKQVTVTTEQDSLTSVERDTVATEKQDTVTSVEDEIQTVDSSTIFKADAREHQKNDRPKLLRKTSINNLIAAFEKNESDGSPKRAPRTPLRIRRTNSQSDSSVSESNDSLSVSEPSQPTEVESNIRSGTKQVDKKLDSFEEGSTVVPQTCVEVLSIVSPSAGVDVISETSNTHPFLNQRMPDLVNSAKCSSMDTQGESKGNDVVPLEKSGDGGKSDASGNDKSDTSGKDKSDTSAITSDTIEGNLLSKLLLLFFFFSVTTLYLFPGSF